MKVELPRAHLTVIWCDRCGRAVNRNDEPCHHHTEQCGGCRKYQRIDMDWGYCKNNQSVYCGRPMFEHDTCSKWVEGEWSRFPNIAKMADGETSMTLILELSAELERDLAARADKLQIPLTEYAMRLLSAGCPATPTLASGADLVEYWRREGLVGTRPEIADAPEHARSIRQTVERRVR